MARRTHKADGLPANLRRLRDLRGWTREAAAEAIGIATETLARFERGERKPSLPVVLRLAVAFDVTVEELAGVRRTDGDEAPLVSASLRTLRRLDARRLHLAHEMLILLEKADL